MKYSIWHGVPERKFVIQLVCVLNAVSRGSSEHCYQVYLCICQRDRSGDAQCGAANAVDRAGCLVRRRLDLGLQAKRVALPCTHTGQGQASAFTDRFDPGALESGRRTDYWGLSFPPSRFYLADIIPLRFWLSHLLGGTAGQVDASDEVLVGVLAGARAGIDGHALVAEFEGHCRLAVQLHMV